MRDTGIVMHHRDGEKSESVDLQYDRAKIQRFETNSGFKGIHLDVEGELSRSIDLPVQRCEVKDARVLYHLIMAHLVSVEVQVGQGEGHLRKLRGGIHEEGAIEDIGVCSLTVLFQERVVTGCEKGQQ